MFKAPEQLIDALLAAWPTHDEHLDFHAFVARIERIEPGSAQAQGLWLRAERGFQRGAGLLIEDANGKYSIARFAIHDGNGGPEPGYVATLCASGRGWRLTAFAARCPSCLGRGFLPETDALCDTCGGTGWGVASCTAIPPPKPSRLAV